MQIVNRDQFSYIYDQGNFVVIRIDRASVNLDLDEKIALGKDGEEGVYVVEELLLLATDDATQQIAAVLSHPGAELTDKGVQWLLDDPIRAQKLRAVANMDDATRCPSSRRLLDVVARTTCPDGHAHDLAPS